MKTRSALILCLVMVMLNRPVSVFAETPRVVDSNKLLYDAVSINDKTISYTGEIIGDIMVRADGTWLNISDGTNAIGVFLPSSISIGDLTPGNYQHTGDQVTITGTFHRACPDHGGDLDVHAQSLTLVGKGKPVIHAFRPVKAAMALFLLPPVAWMTSIILRRNRRWRI